MDRVAVEAWLGSRQDSRQGGWWHSHGWCLREGKEGRELGWCLLCPSVTSSHGAHALSHSTHVCALPSPDGNINTADPEWESPCLKDLEVVYLTWDVLYIDGRCVCHLPLLERRELLRRAVRDAPPQGGRALGRGGWW